MKYISGILLFIISIILGVFIIPISIIYAVARAAFLELSRLLWMMAYSVDQLGNTSCQVLFNDILIKKNGHKFGNADETISSVLGKNKATGTLTKLGRWLANLLNRIDKNHVENAVEKNK